jgi:hypothetical protein
MERRIEFEGALRVRGSLISMAVIASIATAAVAIGPTQAEFSRGSAAVRASTTSLHQLRPHRLKPLGSKLRHHRSRRHHAHHRHHGHHLRRLIPALADHETATPPLASPPPMVHFKMVISARDPSLGHTYYSSWVTRCEASYRSFDPHSGTFRGEDGRRHRCE